MKQEASGTDVQRKFIDAESNDPERDEQALDLIRKTLRSQGPGPGSR